MKAWLSSVLLVVVAAFVAASGCGKTASVNRNPTPADAASGSGSGGSSGDNANGGREIIVASGGNSADGCPSSCEALNANCGFVTDARCGGVVKCDTCTGTDVCGGTEANRCGPVANNLPDAGTCMPSTCTEVGASCGYVTDAKCGGAVIDCGQNVCPGHCTKGTCTTDACTVDPASTCSGRGYVCGQTIDNCGNVLDCGPLACPNPGDVCVQGVCAPPTACVVDPATTCAGRGYTCGQAADNCGHLLDCGPSTCAIPGWTCGGGTSPGVCGCTGACSQIPSCSAGVSTTLSGKVYDPAGRNPLYHVLVYVANTPSDPALKTFPQGVTCDVCGATAAGTPLMSTPGSIDPPAGEYTDVDGSFTLKNVPSGHITVVIQLGRWRRAFPVNVENSCAANTVPDRTFTMPSTSAQGNIPSMAVVTGNADSLECVLRKIGIAQSEFTNPGKGGRVNFYLGDKVPGQAIDSATPPVAQLFTNGINAYDMTILACQGVDSDQSANQEALRKYAAAGGRVFATHRSFNWLHKNNANAAVPTDPAADNWSQVAQWHDDSGTSGDFSDGPFPVISFLDFSSNPKANAFQGWLSAVNALNPGTPASATVFVVRHDTDAISSVPGQTQQWLYRNGVAHCSVNRTANCTSNAHCAPLVCENQPTKTCTVATTTADCGTGTTCVANTCMGSMLGKQVPVHFTFNTPVNLVQDLSKTPPAVQCGRVLFSDFHVNDANESPTEYYPTQCAENVARATPSPLVCFGQPKKTCTAATQIADCGANDPCVSAGTCTSDAQCTGACVAGKCPWGTACSTSAQCASTCSSGVCLDPMNAQEKLLEYMLFDLGSCVPPGKACVPKTSCPAGQECGYAPDGCGGLVACGTCTDGKSCGVVEANRCGKVTCTPHSCPAEIACGYASDGCNGVANCGTCPSGQTCNKGKCGGTSCTPKSCVDQGLECGQAGDTCGQLLTCPACPPNNACVSGKCVPLSCMPKTCAAQGIQCGPAADGCGNKIANCGTCPVGDLCNYGKCVAIN